MERTMSDNCIFCKIIRGEIPAAKLFEDEDVLAFRDISPAAPTHFLVIPKKHISGPAAVAAEDERLIGKMMRVGSETAAKEGVPDFRAVFNNGAQAGQTVFHIHMHILSGRSLSWPPG
jgi:histidine triad (HIT) family protein